MATQGINMHQPVAAMPYQVMDPKPNYSQRYSSNGGMITGIIQGFCGITVLILGIVSHVMELSWSIFSTGIWSGLGLFALSGLLGIVSSRRRTGVIVGYMVMSILSAIVSFCAAWTYMYVIFGARLACTIFNDYDHAFELDDYDWLVNPSYHHAEDIEDQLPNGLVNCTDRTADLVVNGFLVAVFLLEFIVAIVGSGFTCGGVCCNSRPITTTSMTVISSQPPSMQQGGWQIQQDFTNPPPPMNHVPGVQKI